MKSVQFAGFRERLERAMAKRGFSGWGAQSRLAERSQELGFPIDQGKLSKLIRAKSDPDDMSAKLAFRLSKVLDVPIAWLLTGEGDEIPQFSADAPDSAVRPSTPAS